MKIQLFFTFGFLLGIYFKKNSICICLILCKIEVTWFSKYGGFRRPIINNKYKTISYSHWDGDNWVWYVDQYFICYRDFNALTIDEKIKIRSNKIAIRSNSINSLYLIKGKVGIK